MNIYEAAAGVFRLQYTRHKKIAAAIRAGASRDLFYAKERRLAQVGGILRPMFWITRLILPRETRSEMLRFLERKQVLASLRRSKKRRENLGPWFLGRAADGRGRELLGFNVPPPS